MTTITKKSSLLLTCLLGSILFLFTECQKEVEQTSITNVTKLDLPFYALTKDLMLQTYNANNLSTPIRSVKVTGLISAETILGIDIRANTGQLYALGNTSTLYTINTNTGQATMVGNGPFKPALTSIITGIDFNPSYDVLRIVTSTGQNLRVDPITATVIGVDDNITYKGTAPQISSIATNGNLAGLGGFLSLVDVNTKTLYFNPGLTTAELFFVGTLNIPNSSGNSGLDIAPDGTMLLTVSNDGPSTLYQVNESTAACTYLGTFNTKMIGIAIPTRPAAYIVDANNTFFIFNPSMFGPVGTRPITGLQPGETIYGIDFRPANGQLYALGSTSRLYTIAINGTATQVGSGQFSTLLAGTSFGFDFNPVADRIRVVSNTGQNLRLDPNTGAVAAVDANLNPGLPAISAAAYTNNFPGAATTSLYVIDYATDSLYIQNPPNNGTLTRIGSLGLNVEAGNGFDIGGTTGNAYAALRVGNNTNLYTINLTTGIATLVPNLNPAPFTGQIRGFALGLGF